MPNGFDSLKIIGSKASVRESHYTGCRFSCNVVVYEMKQFVKAQSYPGQVFIVNSRDSSSSHPFQNLLSALSIDNM